MSIPKVSKQNIIDALEFIDENGIPALNESTRYVLVLENGKKIPAEICSCCGDTPSERC